MGIFGKKSDGRNKGVSDDELIGKTASPTKDAPIAKSASDDYISDMISRAKPVNSDSCIEEILARGSVQPVKPVSLIDEILEQESRAASSLKEVDILMLNRFITQIDLRSAKDYVGKNYSLESLNKILGVDYFISLVEKDNIPKNLFQVLNDKGISIHDWSAYFAYTLGEKLPNLAEGMKLAKGALVDEPGMAYTRLKAKQFIPANVIPVIEDYLDGAKEQGELKQAIFMGNILSLVGKSEQKSLSAKVAEAVSSVHEEIASANVELEGTGIVNIYLIKAICEFNKGNLKEAYAVVNKVPELDYKNRVTEYMKALIGIAAKGQVEGLTVIGDFLKEYPDYVPAIFQKAKLLKSTGDLASSILLLETLSQQGNSVANKELYSIFMQENLFNDKELVVKARRFLTCYVANGQEVPDKDKVYFRKGMLNKKIGNLDEAVEDLDRAFEMNTRLYQALREKAEIQRQRGNFAVAKRDLQRLIEQGTAEKSPLFYEMGLTLYGEGKFEEAYEQFKNAKSGGTNIDIELFMAKSLAHMIQNQNGDDKPQKAKQALSHVEEARKINGNDYRVFLEEGNLCSLMGDNNHALAAFGNGLKLDPNNIELLTELGKTYYKLDRVNEAKESFSLVSGLVGEQGRKHEISYLIAICDFHLKNYKEVAKALSDIVENNVKIGGIENSQNPVLLYFLGESLYHLGEFSKAIKPLEELATLKKVGEIDDESVDIHKMLGDCYFGKKDFEMARRYYEIVLSRREEGSVIFNMAAICGSEKKHEDAMLLYKQAIENNTSPTVLAAAWHELAKIQHGQKQYESAQQSLENSLQIVPDNRDAYILLASMHEGSNPEKANQILDRALAQWPDDAELLERQIKQLTILGQNEKVLANLDKLIDKESGKVSLYEQKYRILEYLKRYSEAESVVEQMTFLQAKVAK